MSTDKVAWLHDDICNKWKIISGGFFFYFFYFSTQNYRLIIRPATVTSFAWFAISVGSLSYGGFPIAFIAKEPSAAFRIPEILDGKYKEFKKTIFWSGFGKVFISCCNTAIFALTFFFHLFLWKHYWVIMFS